MRAYLPLTSVDLLTEAPPDREIITPLLPPAPSGSDVDDACEDSLDDAAFSSLQLDHELGLACGRVVGVGDLPPGQSAFGAWSQLDALMVEGNTGREVIAKIHAAGDDSEVTSLVEALFEIPLEWFDITERAAVAAFLANPSR